MPTMRAIAALTLCALTAFASAWAEISFRAADMKQSKKITVSAMAIALSVVFMSLGAFIEVLDLTVAAITSCVMAFVFIEVGKPYTYFVWLGTSVLSFAFFPHSFNWISYLILFGFYPILKAYIEKTPKALWIPIKLAYFLVGAVLMVAASTYILGIPFLDEEISISFFKEHMGLLRICVFLALVLALFLYDVFMTVMIRTYFSSIRRRIERFLK